MFAHLIVDIKCLYNKYFLTSHNKNTKDAIQIVIVWNPTIVNDWITCSISGLVINQIFNEDDISCEFKIKCADRDESTLLHKTDQALSTLRHIIPFHRQSLSRKDIKKSFSCVIIFI